MIRKAKLIYFKDTGKYYSEAEVEIPENITYDGYVNPVDGKLEPFMWAVAAWVKSMDAMPGLVSNWSYGHIVIMPIGDWGYPTMIPARE